MHARPTPPSAANIQDEIALLHHLKIRHGSLNISYKGFKNFVNENTKRINQEIARLRQIQAVAAAGAKRNAAIKTIQRAFRNKARNAVMMNTLKNRYYRIHWKAGKTVHYRQYNPKTMARMMGFRLSANTTNNAAAEKVNTRLGQLQPGSVLFLNPNTRSPVLKKHVTKINKRAGPIMRGYQ